MSAKSMVRNLLAPVLGVLVAANVLAGSAAGATEVHGSLAGVWTAAESPYVVTGNSIIAPGTSLTIEAGVEVRFGTNFWLQVNGILTTLGAPGNEVVFTSNQIDPAPGDWYSIYVENGAEITFHDTWVEYAGGSAWDAVDTFSGIGTSLIWDGGGVRFSANNGIDVRAVTFDLRNLQVHDNDGDGIALSGNAGPPVLDQIDVSDNGGRAIEIGANIGDFPATLTGSGNGFNGIFITGALGAGVPGTYGWAWNPDLPLVIDQVSVRDGVTLQVDPGSVIKFLSPSSDLTISTGGTLRSLGAPPSAQGGGGAVWFTSFRDDSVGGDTNGDGNATTPTPADWEGIFLGTDTVTDLTETWITYGGGGPFAALATTAGLAQSVDWNGGGVLFSAADGIRVSLQTGSFQNLSLRNNVNHGLELLTSTTPPLLADIESRDNGDYAFYIRPRVGDLGPSLVASGNGIDGVVVGSNLPGPGTWTWNTRPDVAIVLAEDFDVVTDQVLEIGPGVVIKALGPTVDLEVRDGGILRTLGTATVTGDPIDQPVWFTSIADDAHGGDTNGDGNATTPAAGDWSGLLIQNASVAELADTWFAYGGASTEDNVGTTVGSATSVSWVGGGSLWSGNAGLGIAAVDVDVQQVRFNGNAGDGVTLDASGSAAFSACDFTGNGFGMRNLRTAPSIDAQSCWWDDPSGPFDPAGNPGGAGQPISDAVTYDGWLVTPATNLSPDAFSLVSPADGATEVSPDAAVFEWSVATDPDGDSVGYDVEIATSPLFDVGSIVAEVSGLSVTSWSPSASLPGETTLYWRAIARDEMGGSTLGTPSYAAFTTGPGSSASADEPGSSALAFSVGRVTPNPFGSAASLSFTLPRTERVLVTVHGAGGRRVRVLEQGTAGAGLHVASWDGRDDSGRLVSSGTYFYRVQSESGVRTERAVLIR